MIEAAHFTDSKFNTEVLEAHLPVLVDFWAVWCGPCRKIAPTVEELANDFQGRAIVGKVDVDNNPEIASRFGIRSIPTILIFKDGQVVEQIVGVASKQQLADALNNHIGATV